MKVNVQTIHGNWDLGHTLDKHMLYSNYVGDNDQGHPQFESVRTEVGEALYQLKYCSAFEYVPLIGQQLHASLGTVYSSASVIVSMPPSKQRWKQPVEELAKDLAARMQVPYVSNLLVKTSATEQMKDIADRAEKVRLLKAAFSVDRVPNLRSHDVLIVDDLFDTGSSLEAATHVLKAHPRIRKVFAAVITRRRNA